MAKSLENRRQFLKNTSLAALALGISPLVSHAKNSEASKANACNRTTLDYYGEGPFYTENPPFIIDGKLAKDSEEGTRIRITGRVQNLDCSEFIPNTIIDVWHANDAGEYDNDGFNLRGQVKSNEQGFYMFETIKPGKYLNGTKYRPSHIHFKITPPGFGTIITQLYFHGDTSIADDAAASISDGQFDATHRTIALTKNNEGMLEGTWDIAINGKGTMGAADLHLDKGMIYNASPNPFSKVLRINYGVFKPSVVSLVVFNMQGKEVALLEKRGLSAAKYEAEWTPNAELPDGYYFVSLKINDLQVHYLKVFLNRN